MFSALWFQCVDDLQARLHPQDITPHSSCHQTSSWSERLPSCLQGHISNAVAILWCFFVELKRNQHPSLLVISVICEFQAPWQMSQTKMTWAPQAGFGDVRSVILGVSKVGLKNTRICNLVIVVFNGIHLKKPFLIGLSCKQMWETELNGHVSDRRNDWPQQLGFLLEPLKAWLSANDRLKTADLYKKDPINFKHH